MRATIDTSRLILRPFESDDVEAAFGWLGDPTVMRFTPTGPDTSIEQTKARLANYQEHQTVHGFSKWIICLAERRQLYPRSKQRELGAAMHHHLLLSAPPQVLAQLPSATTVSAFPLYACGLRAHATQ